MLISLIVYDSSFLLDIISLLIYTHSYVHEIMNRIHEHIYNINFSPSPLMKSYVQLLDKYMNNDNIINNTKMNEFL